MKKNLLAGFLAMIMLLSCFSLVATATEVKTATFQVATVEGNKGDIVYVDIVLSEENTYLGVLDANIVFDTSHLKLVNHPDSGYYDTVSVGEVIRLAGANFVCGDVDSALDGSLAVAVSAVEGIRESGVFCTVAFEIVEEIPAGQTALVSFLLTVAAHYQDASVSYDIFYEEGGVVPPIEPDDPVEEPEDDTPVTEPDIDQPEEEIPSASNTATFNVETVKGHKGETVILNVYLLEANTGIGVLEATLSFDATYLKMVKHPDAQDSNAVVKGEVVRLSGATYVSGALDSALDGSVKVAIATADGIKKSGLFCSAAFEIVEEIPANNPAVVSFDVTSVRHYDDTTFTYQVTSLPGGVEGVGEESTEEEPEDDPPVADPPEDDHPIESVTGDINGDDIVNAKDALLVLKIAVGKTQPTSRQESAADVNCDGTVNAKDALEILKYSVGKPSALG